MIPRTELSPNVPSPVPECSLPTSEEISEEGFGYFRGTWFMGRVPVSEAQEVVEAEAEILEWLDQVADNAEEFDILANAIETQDAEEAAAALGLSESPAALARFVPEGDFSPFGGLETGVAGLCNALSVAGCLTAASCRSHATPHSWSDCPVVFFAAPTWRTELLADLIAAEGCGLDVDRDMLKIYAPSVREMHGLACVLLTERRRFRRMPDRWRTRRHPSSMSTGTQLSLLPQDG